MLTFYSAGITPHRLSYILSCFAFQHVAEHLTFLIHNFQYAFLTVNLYIERRGGHLFELIPEFLLTHSHLQLDNTIKVQCVFA